MEFLNGLVNVFQTYIFDQPFIFLSLVAMFGLILQKKSIDKIITGSLKTGIGYLISTGCCIKGHSPFDSVL